MKLIILIVFLGISSCNKKQQPTVLHPNIVIILADDLGYGDLGSYNKNSLIPTPNLDRLASEGIRLTNAYCPVSVCSPSRFALMTGNYPWRSWKKQGVMSNYEPSMIANNQLTLPGMLQESGYITAGYGKWHLGATFSTIDGEKPSGYGKFKAEDNGSNLDLFQPISDGPIDHGFDHWMGFSCASECWVMEDKKIVGALKHDYYTIESTPNKDHITSIALDEFLPLVTKKSIEFLKKHKTQNSNKPFFLYYAPYVPHVPLAVGKKFIGMTEAGLYGDYVHELDYNIGKVLKTLDELNLSDNTIVIFASDNGSEFQTTNVKKSELDTIDESKTHHPNGLLKGTKWSIYEGGVRTPIIAKWPKNFPAGVTSAQLFSLNDIIATFSSVIDYNLPDNQAVDSYNLLSVLKGEKKDIRKSVLVQSYEDMYAIRKGKWKYVDTEQPELYDLSIDISESNNVINENLDVAIDLKNELLKLKSDDTTN